MAKAMIAAIETKEVSVVEAGAVRRRFAITKSEGQKMDPEILKAVLETEAKGEKEFVASLKSEGKSAEQVAASVAGMRFMLGYKDVIDGAQLAQVAKAVGITLPVEKAESAPKPIVANKALEAELVEVRKSNASLAEDLKLTTARLDAMSDAEEIREAVTKAEELFPKLGEPDKVGAFLKALKDVSPELRTQGEEILGAANERAVMKSDLFNEIGSQGGNPGDGSSENELERIAKEIRTKSLTAGVDMSEAEGWSKAMDLNPDLYTKSIQEKRFKGAH